MWREREGDRRASRETKICLGCRSPPCRNCVSYKLTNFLRETSGGSVYKIEDSDKWLVFSANDFFYSPIHFHEEYECILLYYRSKRNRGYRKGNTVPCVVLQNSGKKFLLPKNFATLYKFLFKASKSIPLTYATKECTELPIDTGSQECTPLHSCQFQPSLHARSRQRGSGQSLFHK